MSKERVFLTELSRYLHHNHAAVRKFAKRQGLMRRVSLGPCRKVAEYVSPYGAQRIIAHIRALQGDAYLLGHRFHEVHAREAARMRSKGLAIRLAGTEDERQRSACAISESRKPRGVR